MASVAFVGTGSVDNSSLQITVSKRKPQMLSWSLWSMTNFWGSKWGHFGFEQIYLIQGLLNRSLPNHGDGTHELVVAE